MVDDLDAGSDRVLLGQLEVDLGVDADQVELRAGRHLVDELGDGGAVVRDHRRPTSCVDAPPQWLIVVTDAGSAVPSSGW